jgi:hypothetical protein
MDVKSEDADRLEETGTTVQNDAVPRTNKFGSIRLLLAFLVIVSHSSELVDGNRSREMLTRIFGTISLGEFAVNGVFDEFTLSIEASIADRSSVRGCLSGHAHLDWTVGGRQTVQPCGSDGL